MLMHDSEEIHGRKSYLTRGAPPFGAEAPAALGTVTTGSGRRFVWPRPNLLRARGSASAQKLAPSFGNGEEIRPNG